MRALHTAATGMMAQELNVSTQLPSGIAIGSGVKAASTIRAMSRGNLTLTERDYDVAIRGDGYFRIRMPDGKTAYSRDGSFDLDSQGQLVTRDGYLIEPGITVPQTAKGITITAAGQVQATLPGQTAPQDLGQLQLARFINKTGLESIGDNLFLETAASGPAVDGNPGSEGFGNFQQSHLEEANVNAVTELSSLIAAQRAYEMNAKVVSAADQVLQSSNQMARG
jgi:flagellar basal-body rod protein FlgG